MNDFFVILTTQSGDYTAMVDDEGDLATFYTKEEARYSALNNVLGENFGYEIFERGYGDS